MSRSFLALAAIVVLITATLCLTGIARSDAPASGDSASLNSLKQTCEEIVTRFSRGEPKAYELLDEHYTAPMASGVDQAAQNVLTLRSILAIQDRWGAFLGSELVREKKTNQTLRRYDYLAKYEKCVVVWSFILYQPHDKWKIVGYFYNANAEAVNAVLN